MSDASNDTLVEQAKAKVRDRLKRETARLTPTEVASATADVDIFLDLAPVSAGAGPAEAAAPRPALTTPLRIASVAPETAEALEAMLKAGDDQACVIPAILLQADLTPEQTRAARAQALNTVRQAVSDARQRLPGRGD